MSFNLSVCALALRPDLTLQRKARDLQKFQMIISSVLESEAARDSALN